MIGKINSIETMGLVDGPGVRFVVFMQGCPLRCKFCHNPETWDFNIESDSYTPEELIKKILNYKPYFKHNGGVTFSGGEPLMQKEFLLECERKLAKSYVCTALGRDDDSIAITKEIAKDIAFEVTNSVHPISMETAPYVVAALRTLANGIEKEMNPLNKEIARALQELMGRFQFVKEEVKIDL